MSSRSDWKQWSRGKRRVGKYVGPQNAPPGGYKLPPVPTKGRLKKMRKRLRKGESMPLAAIAPLKQQQPISSRFSALTQQGDAATVGNATKVEGVLHFDGSCRPNPGYASCGYVVKTGGRVIEKSHQLGWGTNNIAEWQGIVFGLQAAFDAGVTHLEVYGDSLIVIRDMQKGRPGSGVPHLARLKAEAHDLAKKFSEVIFQWVPREENAEADALSVR